MTKYCKDCQYYFRSNGCSHPSNETISIVTGEKTYVSGAIMLRSRASECGDTALRFVKRQSFMKRVIRLFAGKSFFRVWFVRTSLDGFAWYRKWYGGRWERHYIEFTHSCIWYARDKGKAWPESTFYGSRGTPLIEIYPYKD